MISLYVDEAQDDWDDFLPSALYSHNSSVHATHGFQPNELMLGRKLRTPAELLRKSRLAHPHSTLQEYHEVLLQDLKKAREVAAMALQKEQARQAMYYNQWNVRQRAEFRPEQLVWIYRPARGPGVMKFGHRWRGPAKIIEAAGYDNYRVQMMESGDELVTHCSFLLSYYYPNNLLEEMAKDIALDLREEAIAAADVNLDNEVEATPDLVDLQAIQNNRTPVPDLTAATEQPRRPEATQTPSIQDQPTARQKRRAQGKRRREERQELADTVPADESSARDAATEPRVRRQRVRAAPAGPDDAIAGRTRARIRRAPYKGGGADGNAGTRAGSPTQARADGTALVPSDSPDDGHQHAPQPPDERQGP
jgi:hypothetical protein